MDDDTPFEQGQAARKVGLPTGANPYEEESLAYYHWQEGWEDGDQLP